MTNFGNDFSGCSVKGAALDDVLRFASAAVALALDDLAREDDVFKVKDGELVIFKFGRGVGGSGYEISWMRVAGTPGAMNIALTLSPNGER